MVVKNLLVAKHPSMQKDGSQGGWTKGQKQITKGTLYFNIALISHFLLIKDSASVGPRQKTRSLASYLHLPFLKCYFHLFFTPIPGIFTNLTSRLRCAKQHSLSLGVQPLMGDKPIPGAQPPNSLPRPSAPQPSSPTA